MGCKASLLKSQKDPAKKKGHGFDVTSQRSHSRGRAGNLSPDFDVSRWHKDDKDRSPGASKGHSATEAEVDAGAMCLAELCMILDNMTDVSSLETSLSAPKLFRVTPAERAEEEPGTVAWWRQELRRGRVTKDGYRRIQLEDIHARLATQREEDPSRVELDLSNSFMERTAPYVLGRLFVSREFKELRWITSLRLDGNYFTDDGFGTMLVTMSAANEEQTIMPSLRQLYFNNMNLDRNSVAGLFAYLFPVDRKATRSIPMEDAFRIAGSRLAKPSEAYLPAKESSPTVPLFPSLTVLSLSDNPGVGTAGLIQILRNFLAVHYEPCPISVIDLSRCGMDAAASRYLQEYLEQFSTAMERGFYPVVPQRFVLMGNSHGIEGIHQVNTRGNTSVEIVL